MKYCISILLLLTGVLSSVFGQDSLGEDLAQMLIVNADGYGYSGEWAVHPAYFDLVEELQPGGILLHYNTTDLEIVKNTNNRVKELSKTVPFITVDYVYIENEAGKRYILGDGFTGGFIDYNWGISVEQLKEVSDAQALLLRNIGVNLMLGPTIDNSVECILRPEKGDIFITALKRQGIVSVIKHFPYLPLSTNLHNASPDMKGTKYSTDIFAESAHLGQVAMTTHIFNSEVDDTLVTFSEKWVEMLRNDTGFEGLLMSDGLYMIQNFKNDGAGFYDPTVIEKIDGIHDVAQYAVQAILAGHDLLILEGVANETRRIYSDLLNLAGEDSPLGAELRSRITKSAEKIRRLKSDMLLDPVEFDSAILEESLAALFYNK